MQNNKRKDDEGTSATVVITYHAGLRVFKRLFKERSLEELQNVVRRKLGLEGGEIIKLKLKQMLDDTLVDLDDDDDFEAFSVYAHNRYQPSIDIKVIVEKGAPEKAAVKKRKVAPSTKSNVPTTGLSVEPMAEPSVTKGKKRKAPENSAPAVGTMGMVSTVPNMAVEQESMEQPPPKKKRKPADDSVVIPTGEPSKSKEPSKASESKGHTQEKSAKPSQTEAGPPAKKSTKAKDHAGKSKSTTGGTTGDPAQPSAPSKPKKVKKSAEVGVDETPGSIKNSKSKPKTQGTSASLKLKLLLLSPLRQLVL